MTVLLSISLAKSWWSPTGDEVIGGGLGRGCMYHFRGTLVFRLYVSLREVTLSDNLLEAGLQRACVYTATLGKSGMELGEWVSSPIPLRANQAKTLHCIRESAARLEYPWNSALNSGLDSCKQDQAWREAEIEPSRGCWADQGHMEAQEV